MFEFPGNFPLAKVKEIQKLFEYFVFSEMRSIKINAEISNELEYR